MSTLEFDDLIRGEGEWRNMQDIIRRTFRQSFEKIGQQQDQISQLIASVSSLKSQLAAKPTNQEIDDMILSKIRTSPKHITRDEIDDIRLQLANVRADMQRKSSIRYVDDSLRRKLDKTDVLVKNFQSMHVLEEYTEIIKISSDLGEMKSKYDILAKTLNEVCEDIRSTAKAGDMFVVRELVEELYKMMGDCVTTIKLDECLTPKVNSNDLAYILEAKADKVEMSTQIYKLDKAFADHEKFITAIRLKMNDEGVFYSDYALGDTSLKNASYHFKSKHRGNQSQTRWNQAEESFESQLTDFGKGENNFFSLGNKAALDVRMEVIVKSLWQNIQTMSRDLSRVKDDNKVIKERLLSAESTTQLMAGLEQVGILATVVEEQKLRIDSLICGSTVVEPIQREIVNINKSLVEIQEYLKLPKQHRNIDDQLKEAANLIDSLGKTVSEIASGLCRMGNRVEAMERIHSQIESRVLVVEDSNLKSEERNLDVNSESFKAMVRSVHTLSSKVKELHEILWDVDASQKVTVSKVGDSDRKIGLVEKTMSVVQHDLVESQKLLKKLCKVAKRDHHHHLHQHCTGLPTAERQPMTSDVENVKYQSQSQSQWQSYSNEEMRRSLDTGSRHPLSSSENILELKEEKRRLSQRLKFSDPTGDMKAGRI